MVVGVFKAMEGHLKFRSKLLSTAAMIRVGMGYNNCLNISPDCLKRGQDIVEMHPILRTGINDNSLIFADQIGVGAKPRHR